MSNTTLGLADNLVNYMRAQTVRESAVALRCREETATLPEARMQIAPEQGQYLAFLVKALQCRRVLEIGVFTGYSSLWMAEALPDDGELVGCDISAEYTDLAKRYWLAAGVADKITLHLGDALPTLKGLQAGYFDLAFIDADKESELAYFQETRRLVRPGGMILIDNAFWSGHVADATKTDAATQGIRDVTKAIFADGTNAAVLLPIADGLIMMINT